MTEVSDSLERQRESEHRVKNTLQLISSIIMLQGRHGSSEAQWALKALQRRVAAVNVAHRRVEWANDGERIEVSKLVRDVVAEMVSSAERDDLAVDLELEDISIAARHGAPFALIVCEAVGNALRHAYPSGPGRVRVGLRRAGENVELVVADEGCGCPAGPPSPAFGLTVLRLMAQQLRGALETDSAPPGVRVTVCVPAPRLGA